MSRAWRSTGGRVARCIGNRQDRELVSRSTVSARERPAWVAGVVFVVALLAEAVISTGIPITQDDSAEKIAGEIAAHSDRVLVATYLSIVYATAFVIYLCKLHGVLRTEVGRARGLPILVLVGGALQVALHGVSDIGIYGLLGGKIAAYHDAGITYTLYLTTFALDSVGDVFGSLFLLAAGLLILDGGAMPRWLGWTAIVAGVLLFLQGFGLGGVINTFGLVSDLLGFVLFLVFVLGSSVTMLRRGEPLAATESGPR
jgi:hypothetical protein